MGREGVDKRPKITESNRQEEAEQGQGGKKRVLSIVSGCRSFVANANYQGVPMVSGIMEMSNWSA